MYTANNIYLLLNKCAPLELVNMLCEATMYIIYINFSGTWATAVN